MRYRADDGKPDRANAGKADSANPGKLTLPAPAVWIAPTANTTSVGYRP